MVSRFAVILMMTAVLAFGLEGTFVTAATLPPLKNLTTITAITTAISSPTSISTALSTGMPWTTKTVAWLVT